MGTRAGKQLQFRKGRGSCPSASKTQSPNRVNSDQIAVTVRIMRRARKERTGEVWGHPYLSLAPK